MVNSLVILLIILSKVSSLSSKLESSAIKQMHHLIQQLSGASLEPCWYTLYNMLYSMDYATAMEAACSFLDIVGSHVMC